MSFSKTKTFLASGLLLAVTLTMVVTLSAEDWDGRLWKPYQPEQFGGSRRSADGVYGAIEMLYWKLDGPRNLVQFNQILDVSELPTSFELGTRITFGNRRGHHGWLFSAYGLSGIGGSIADERISWDQQGTFERWYTYYWYRSYWYKSVWNWMDVVDSKVELKSQSRVFNFDLSWTYRPHPFRWGEIEFFAGAKYWDLNDKLDYSDLGFNNVYIYYGWEDPDNVNPTTSVAVGTPTTATLYGRAYWYDFDDYTPIPMIIQLGQYRTQEATNRMVGPHLGCNITRRNSRWTFGAAPAVFLGVNNQSFTFRETASVRLNEPPTNATMPAYTEMVDYDYVSEASNLTVGQLNSLKRMSTEMEKLAPTTYRKLHRSVFSPGVSLQLSAKWQWTDAVGIKFGFDSTIMNNVARGNDLVATPIFVDENGNRVSRDYANKSGDGPQRDGYDFSLRSKGDVVILYGISIGLEMKR